MSTRGVAAVAAAIAYAELNRGKDWRSPSDLWAAMDDGARRDYRKMARAAIAAIDGFNERHAA